MHAHQQGHEEHVEPGCAKGQKRIGARQVQKGRFARQSIKDSAERGGFCPIVNAIVGKSPWRLGQRSEEHTSELQSLMRISYAVFCLKKKQENEKYIAMYTT